MRIAEDAMAPRVRAGAYVWVDPAEPAADGRRTLRALDGRCPERAVDAGNETGVDPTMQSSA